MMKTHTLKAAALLTVVLGFVASQSAQAGDSSDKGKTPAPCPPPIIICNPPPQCGHNYCTPTPPCEKSSPSCNLFQTSVILLLTQCK
jgi:hypothetical protein